MTTKVMSRVRIQEAGWKRVGGTWVRVRAVFRGTKEYNAYSAARQRCTNPNNPRYKDYGGRGIKFLFKNFREFADHIGFCPSGCTLDRKDTNGHYEPGNVRWVPPTIQNRNTRRNRFVTAHGKTQTVAEWARELGIHEGMITHRLKVMSPEMACSSARYKAGKIPTKPGSPRFRRMVAPRSGKPAWSKAA